MQLSYAKQGNDGTLAFSQLILVYLLAGKPLVDLIFFWEPAKYLYMGLLFLGGLFAYMGNHMGGRQSISSGNFIGVIFYLLLAFYALHLFSLNSLLNGNKIEILKILSPFITVSIVGLCLKVDLRPYLKVVMIASIVINFLSLPFDFSWIMWGSARTFKGFYFFKLDLAFAVLNSLIVYYFCSERKVDVLFSILSVMVVIMIVLSNSRMNYLLITLFFIYVAICQGISWISLMKIGVLMAVVAVIAISLYDANKFISPFDTSNMEGFTQGRNVIWERIITKGLGEANGWQLIFGQGLFADYLLGERNDRGAIHNAHNELLHLLITQGTLGLFVYIILWILAVKYLVTSKGDLVGYQKVFITIIFGFFILQGVTTVVISFYLKTWWLLCCLVCCRGELTVEKNSH